MKKVLLVRGPQIKGSGVDYWLDWDGGGWFLNCFVNIVSFICKVSG